MELSRRALASLWGRMFTTQSSDPAVVSSAGDAMPTVASPDERSQTQELTATATWWTLLLLLIPWQKPRPTEEWDASRGIGDWQSRLEQYNAWAAQAGTAGGEEDDSSSEDDDAGGEEDDPDEFDALAAEATGGRPASTGGEEETCDRL